MVFNFITRTCLITKIRKRLIALSITALFFIMAGKKAASSAAATVAKQTEKLKKAAEVKEEKKAAEAKEVKASKEKVVAIEETTDNESEEKPVKEKRAPTEYQLFRKQKLAELREEYDDEETRPSYQDLMKMVNEAWHEENPKKEKTPKAKTPKEKKERKTKVADGEEKKKRAPSAYNIFIKEIMPKIKSEHENDDPKLNQKDLMKIAAQKWNEHKTTVAA